MSAPVLPPEQRARRTIPRTVRRAVYERDGGRCRYCGHWLRLDTFTLDHVLAHSRGGADDAANLVTACAACNTRKRRDRAEDRGLTLRPIGYTPPLSSAARHRQRKADRVLLSKRP